MKTLGIDLPHWLPTWHQVVPAALLFVGGAILVVLIQRVLGRAFARASRHTPLSAQTAMVVQRLVTSAM